MKDKSKEYIAGFRHGIEWFKDKEMKNKNKEYIKGFRHGINWFKMMMKSSLYKYTGTISQGELGSLEIEIDNIIVDSKKAMKSLKGGK